MRPLSSVRRVDVKNILCRVTLFCPRQYYEVGYPPTEEEIEGAPERKAPAAAAERRRRKRRARARSTDEGSEKRKGGNKGCSIRVAVATTYSSYCCSCAAAAARAADADAVAKRVTAAADAAAKSNSAAKPSGSPACPEGFFSVNAKLPHGRREEKPWPTENSVTTPISSGSAISTKRAGSF